MSAVRRPVAASYQKAYWIDRAFPPGFNAGTRGVAHHLALEPYRKAVIAAIEHALLVADQIPGCDDVECANIAAYFAGLPHPRDVHTAMGLVRLEEDFNRVAERLIRAYRPRLYSRLFRPEAIGA